MLAQSLGVAPAREGVSEVPADCWGQLEASCGEIRVERLAAETGWSRKRLWSRFRAQIGLSPKRAAQLIRFDHAAHRLAAGQSAALVAAESGYVDQSHLHRDVVAFAGKTPTAIAVEPFLAVDDVAWPAPRGGARVSRLPIVRFCGKAACGRNYRLRQASARSALPGRSDRR
jgi:AraC-like DNA-binding protein